MKFKIKTGGIFRTNNPLEYAQVDGIVIDERAPAPNVQGVGTGRVILVGQFQRGLSSLERVSSTPDFFRRYGRSSYLGNIQLRNKKFSDISIIRVIAATGSAKASRTFSGGAGSTAEIFTIETVADSSGSLDGTYFTFELADSSGNKTEYYAWLNVDAGGNDPAVSGRTGVPVAISSDATADAVASAVQSALDALTDASASVSTNTVTVTAAHNFDVTDAADADSGFTITVTQQGDDANIVTFTAKHEGAYGNNITVTIEAGSVSGKKYTIIDGNPNNEEYFPNEIYDNVELSGISAEDFAQVFSDSLLVDASLVTNTSEPSNSPAVALESGSDGTIADTDYETAIAKANAAGAANFVFLDEYNQTRNLYLKAHHALTQDRMVIMAEEENDTVSDNQADVALLRDTDGGLIYASNWVRTTIDGEQVYTSPASWYASILSQTAPNIDPAFAGNTQFLFGATGLKKDLSRNDYIALMEAGVSAFEFDNDIGFKIKSGVVTQIANSSKLTVVRRRMAYFLTDSIGRFLKNYQNAVNRASERTAAKAAIERFIKQQEDLGILPSDAEVQDGLAKLVDIESENSNDTIAEGKFFILYKQRIFSSMRFIVLKAEIGESVVVTEGE